jgi:regulator of protease activity HflC (stomatin/prohibitin superfamily)
MGFIIAAIILIAIISGLRVVDQYELGVVLRFGRYIGTKSPGLRFILPYGIDRMIKVDTRIATVDVPRQEVITKDNVTIYVDAVVYFRVKDVQKAVLDVQNFRLATAQYAQAALRDVVGQEDLDTILSERDRISATIKEIVDKATEPWGVDVPDVKMQKMELPEDMKRVIAKQAEAEREKRSVITKASGELEASQNLASAAQKLASTPGALHLRTLTTLNDLSSDQSNTVIFAVPLEILRAFESVGETAPAVLGALRKAVKSEQNQV